MTTGKNPTQRDQKQLYLIVLKKKRRNEKRDEGQISENKSKVYIIRLFLLLVS